MPIEKNMAHAYTIFHQHSIIKYVKISPNTNSHTRNQHSAEMAYY